MSLIHIKTDTGATVAAASFVGDECFGVTKVERVRKPGESRRVRRMAQPIVEKAPRDPRVAALVAEANALYERQQEAIRVAVAAGVTRLTEEDASSPVELSRPSKRRRGDTLPISSLSPATLTLLEIGEPTTCVLTTA